MCPPWCWWMCVHFLGLLSLFASVVSILRWHFHLSQVICILVTRPLSFAACGPGQWILVLMHSSPQLSPCLSPHCCPNHLLLLFLVFVTYDNHVMFYVGSCCCSTQSFFNQAAVSVLDLMSDRLAKQSVKRRVRKIQGLAELF